MSQIADVPASEQHLAFLEVVISERFDEVPSRERLPSTKRAVSAMIEQLRSKHAPLPATDEQTEELNRLASELGISILAAGDRAAVNRQLFDLRKRVNHSAWNAAKAEADAAIDELFAA